MFSLVVESLFALLDGREPAVDATRVQQVLRVVDDEIRGEAADAIVRFVRDVSKSKRKAREPRSSSARRRRSSVMSGRWSGCWRPRA